MSDLIRREDAINAMSESLKRVFPEHREIAEKSINVVPSAEPVRHGKWIKADSQQYFRKHYPYFSCSECGCRKDSQKKWNYCPNCGADMMG